MTQIANTKGDKGPLSPSSTSQTRPQAEPSTSKNELEGWGCGTPVDRASIYSTGMSYGCQFQLLYFQSS